MKNEPVIVASSELVNLPGFSIWAFWVNDPSSRLKGNAVHPAQIVVVDDGGSAFPIRVLPGMPGCLGNREKFDPAMLAGHLQ